MAVRIRADRKTIVCAAESAALPGDCYLDDDVHYTLAVEYEILQCVGKDNDGADLWEFNTCKGETEMQTKLESIALSMALIVMCLAMSLLVIIMAGELCDFWVFVCGCR